MKYRTHVTLTLAIGLPLMAASGEVSFLNGCALGIGSLLPDIDHPSSFLGKLPVELLIRHSVIAAGPIRF